MTKLDYTRHGSSQIKRLALMSLKDLKHVSLLLLSRAVAVKQKLQALIS